MSLSRKRNQFFGNKVDIEFTNRSGKTIIVKARLGDSILDTVMDNDIETESYGICGGGKSFMSNFIDAALNLASCIIGDYAILSVASSLRGMKHDIIFDGT